jgi:hypothetical protein
MWKWAFEHGIPGCSKISATEGLLARQPSVVYVYRAFWPVTGQQRLARACLDVKADDEI